MELNIGFRLINFIVPDALDEFKIIGKHGNWIVKKEHDYDEKTNELKRKPTIALETYTIEHENSHDHSVTEELLEEVRHICLSLSYLCGTAITFERSLPFSDVNFITVGDGFPRMRHLIPDNHVVSNFHEFETKLNLMVENFDDNENDNNANIIIHHLLDSNYCWSLEDLFLGLCTVLEIIKQNERRRTNNRNMPFYNSIVSVSGHLNITVLNQDFKNMRNDLIHEGHLSKVTFPGHTKSECADVICDVLNWVDEYLHAIFAINPVDSIRCPANALAGLNSYTTWN
jgi:hypothetical protein